MRKLKDQFGRKIEYLRLSITDRCNLRCKYCMPAEGVKSIPHDEILRYEEYLRIIGVLIQLGIRKIRITGGEPTVRKGIVGFIRALHHLPGIEDLAMTTNGTLLDKLALHLKDAGLNRVNISLDTLKPEKYREITRGGDFSKCWAGIQAAIQTGLNPVKLNVVVQRGFNTDEILDFARLTFEQSIHVRFIEFMSKEAASESLFFSNNETLKILKELAPLEKISKEFGAGPARYFQYKGAKGKIGLISPISHQFCASCNRIRLTAEGKLLLCLGSDRYLDLKTPLRHGISDEELIDLINNALQEKPQGHQFGRKGIMRLMSSIGG
ncbi:cyclic pyranopterin phosphate synthase MoaA [Anoxybacter fermentans]|uniref:GTP 3',8-cyclase n=1 Tax=Anoxybacter fermentans TaxID=1323375 RepID=A0A3S9SYF0_9FIRM|nr:GTP 3',8-cyclase MoaA [Anoxybacter fermentans]AZR73290.1 cyclic pyranopterin phosphate synthase MoaA [Anoxybacter fermentans]